MNKRPPLVPVSLHDHWLRILKVTLDSTAIVLSEQEMIIYSEVILEYGRKQGLAEAGCEVEEDVV